MENVYPRPRKDIERMRIKMPPRGSLDHQCPDVVYSKMYSDSIR